MEKKPRVLCVDDDPRVLEGVALQLRKWCDVEPATSGEEALALLRTRGPFAVILSDMRMPKMDGATLLSAVRKEFPDTVRMLLTGYADVTSAAAAVNEGQVFRFLTKPTTPDVLRQALAAAIEQHQLLIAERVLLEQTLRYSVKALIDVLSLGNPVAFGHAARIWSTAHLLCRELEVPEGWQLEVAAKLSHLGLIILPDATLERHLRGQTLTAEEQGMLARVPAVSLELIAHIPRLEAVRALISYGAAVDPARAARELHPQLRRWAAVLRVAIEYEKLEHEGRPPKEALEQLRARKHLEPAVLDALDALARKKVGASASDGKPREVAVASVAVGMVLVEDVCTTRGVVLVARGNELTRGSVERLQNFPKGYIREPLRILDRHG